MELKTGSVDSTLDDKGRLNIPVRFREQYEGELIMTWGIDQCIYIMTLSAFEDFEKILRNSKEFSRKWRILENKHFAQAMKVEIDKAGRVAIPPTFRKYAKLTRDCMVINSAKGFLSVWDTETFFAYLEQNDPVSQAAFDDGNSGNITGEDME
jgi:MraZ protein